MSRNGLNPRWDKEAAEVVASHPELTQIVLSVCYKPSPTAKAKTLGYAALPLSAVRSGVRCVRCATSAARASSSASCSSEPPPTRATPRRRWRATTRRSNAISSRSCDCHVT